MGRLKIVRKGWSLKRKLILGLTVLILIVLIPVLSINILATSPAETLENNAAGGDTPSLRDDASVPQSTEEVYNPSSTESAGEPQSIEEASNPGETWGAGDIGGEFAAVFRVGNDWIRDPATAAESGVRGFVDVIFIDDPHGLILHRGEQWTGTVLLRAVSHTPDLTEVKINVDLQRSPTRSGTLIKIKSGATSFGGQVAGEMVDFIALLSYSPSGSFVMKAGESLTLSLTITIPQDFPEEIENVRLSTLGIWSDSPKVFIIISPDHLTRKVFIK
jgi:hypothetical protein